MTGARILVVDDEPQILRSLEVTLKQAHYSVVLADSGKNALVEIARRPMDLIVLDLMLSDMNGIDLIHEIRKNSSIPIIMLSAMGNEPNKVAALDAGADDYITKPFGTAEVHSRIKAVMRRWAKSTGPHIRFECDNLSVDFERREVKIDDEPVHLTPKEYDLLKYMIEHAGKVITHRVVLTTLWGPSHIDQAQYLRVFVGQLRKKIERRSDARHFIVTVPGVGYRFLMDS